MKNKTRVIICALVGLAVLIVVTLMIIYFRKDVGDATEPSVTEEEEHNHDHYFIPGTPEPTKEPVQKMTKEEADSLQNRMENAMLIVDEEIPLNPDERVYDENLNVPYWMQMLQTDESDIKETIEKYAADFLRTNWEFDEEHEFLFNQYSQCGFSTTYTVESRTENSRIENKNEDTGETYALVTYTVKKNLFTFVGVSLAESQQGHIQMYVYRTEDTSEITVEER